jgi:CubicO group peptidase (beta-lactamase class C family)
LTSTARIQGHAEHGYGKVADVFAANLATRVDVGAACALYVAGEKVVDLWGGLADARSGRPWAADTPAVVFSCTKGIITICTYLLVQQGRLDLEAPVVKYWPEFGRHGKDQITVRCLLTHRAGLMALDAAMTLDDVLKWRPVIEAIEAQTPLWPPGTAHSYHGLTFGWLAGELIVRVTGTTPGAFFRDALAIPLGLQTWIGLPPAMQSNVAWMQSVDPGEAHAATHADPVLERAYTMGGAFDFPVDRDGVVTFKDARIKAAEFPGAAGISTARGLARLYAGCVSEINGPRLLTRDTIDDAVTVRSQGPQLFGKLDTGHRWGTGFMLNSPPARPMLGDRSFGHDGAGGHLAFGDDDYQVGFGYVVNQMGGAADERANRLTDAVRACLDA